MSTIDRNSNGTFKKGTHWRTRKPFWDKTWLEDAYIHQQRSASDIAKQFGVGETAILYWLGKHGIPTRTISEVRAIKHWGSKGKDNPMFGRTGHLNYNWKGGVTPQRQAEYGHPDVQKFLKSIRVREGRCCKRCGRKSRLDVHHIKSWADYPTLRYEASNCVALCRKCHKWVHSNANTEGEFIEA